MAVRDVSRRRSVLSTSFRLHGASGIFLVLLATALIVRALAFSQALTVQNPGRGTVPLSGKWQFRTGDNPAWANPSHNDSNWEQLSASEPWGSQTQPSYTGYAWYRRHITLDSSAPAATKDLAILIPPVDDVYDLYWNGKKIGSYGSFPPHATWWEVGHRAVYRLPNVSGEGVLALRVWKAPLSSIDPAAIGGFEGVPLIGDASILAKQAKLPYYKNDEHQLPYFLISAVVFVVGIFSLLLYFRDRTQGLFLWLAIYLLASGCRGLQNLSAFQFDLTFRQAQFVTQLVICGTDISMWMILLYLFGMGTDSRWRRATNWVIAVYLTAQIADIITIFLWAHAWSSLPWIDSISTAVYMTTPLYIFVIIGFGLKRRKHLTLWPLIIVVCFTAFYLWFYQLTGQWMRFTHLTWNPILRTIGFHAAGTFFGIIFILNTLMFLTLVFTIAREQFHERQRQARMELEIKSAQEVQKILVPEDTPAIPGLAIASIYRPAEEVGGDFFQVIPVANGGSLIVLGDVSGKGLKAAMTVSLIVGAVRTLADYTQSPAQILNGLNRRLIGRIESGFATCVIARTAPDGTVTLANAGHLAPFRNGEELPVGGSLPLGVMASAEYDEIDFRLHENDSLVFYTDGLVEARNEAGELYGFERVATLTKSAGSVEEIVEAACAFGQQDDITVLRLTRLAESVAAHQSRIHLAAQIARA